MSIPGIVTRGRAAHERLMRSTCRIERLGEQVFDPETGDYTQGRETVYQGKCRLKPESGGYNSQAGERPISLRRYILELPWSTQQPVEPDTIVTITSDDDPWAPNVHLVVISVGYGSDRVARRLTLEAQT